MTPRILALLVAIAAALPEILAQAPGLVPASSVPHVLAVVSAIGAVLTGLMRSPLHPKAPELPRSSGESGIDFSAVDRDVEP